MLPRGHRLATAADIVNLRLNEDALNNLFATASADEKGYVDLPDVPGARGTGPWKYNGHNEGHSVLRVPADEIKKVIDANQALDNIIS